MLGTKAPNAAGASITAVLATMNSTAYYIVVPIGPSRMALLGERGKIAAREKSASPRSRTMAC